MNRAEHLKWAKERAIKIAEEEKDFVKAWDSFVSDMNKHKQTQDHPSLILGEMLGTFDSVTGFKKHINGYS